MLLEIRFNYPEKFAVAGPRIQMHDFGVQGEGYLPFSPVKYFGTLPVFAVLVLFCPWF